MRTRPPPSSLLALAFRQDDLVSAAQCESAGVGAARRSRFVRDGTWQRLTHGVFDVVPQRDRRRDADHRRRRAAWLGMLAYGPDAVAVGPCALALHGVRGLPLDIAPEIALASGYARRARDGIRVRQFGAFDSQRHGAGAIAALVPALAQALPELPRAHAVAVLDDALHRGLLPPAGLDAVRAMTQGRRCMASRSSWWDLVDARAESPLETYARLQCVDAGVPPDEPQVEIRSPNGRLLGRGDMGWHLGGGRWLIAEIDGREVHEAPQAVLHDRRRQNALLTSGLVDLLRFTAADIAAGDTIPTAIRRSLRL
ncbi:hypothetical protein [Cellulomonas sp. ICMP 17802]|uniref:hypothetical protein n=1 Tax=Cellulomonas sp. ICMP 17802 TaxID=3239199 RepID=UPI00351BE3FA